MNIRAAQIGVGGSFQKDFKRRYEIESERELRAQGWCGMLGQGMVSENHQNTLYACLKCSNPRI